jgi:hypothetical protein
MTMRKVMAGAAVWLIAAFVGSSLFLYVSPSLEAHFAPVLSNQRAEVTLREPGRVCWRWTWHKERYAQPTVIAWSLVVDGTAVEYPAVVSRRRDGEVIKDIRTASLGPGTNELCAKIPAELDGVTDLVIRGQVNYAVPHGFWTIWQDLPVIPVPPL